MTDNPDIIHHLLDTRYSRQVRFEPIGEAGQTKIMNARMVLIGCGGLGTCIADMLVRAGIGTLVIADRDFVDESNLQRQILFDTDDVARNMPKAEAARKKLKRINPHVQVEAIVRDVDAISIGDIVNGADVILDGTDNFETRFLINDVSIANSIPWVYGAVVGSYGLSKTIVPGKTACLRCLFDHAPSPGTTDTCDTAGIIAPIVHMIASVQACQALKLISGCYDDTEDTLVIFDVWKGEYRGVDMRHARNQSCPACGKKQFEYLNAERGSFVTTLCGRNAVQLSWKESHTINLEEIAAALSGVGDVSCNRFLLKFIAPDATITLFADGRAIIEGTDDPGVARVLYSKYIG